MSSIKSRGLFICIEGCDRAGKSTQSKLLVQHIKSLGRTVEQFRFPGNIYTEYVSIFSINKLHYIKETFLKVGYQ